MTAFLDLCLCLSFVFEVCPSCRAPLDFLARVCDSCNAVSQTQNQVELWVVWEVFVRLWKQSEACSRFLAAEALWFATGRPMCPGQLNAVSADYIPMQGCSMYLSKMSFDFFWCHICNAFARVYSPRSWVLAGVLCYIRFYTILVYSIQLDLILYTMWRTLKAKTRWHLIWRTCAGTIYIYMLYSKVWRSIVYIIITTQDT